MVFRIGKIPVKVSSFFWITAAIIGFVGSEFFSGLPLFASIPILIFMVFISVLVHELGHAATALLFGQRPYIELIAFGGLTYPEGKKIKKWQEFLVVLNGPLFGFALFWLAKTASGFASAVSPLLFTSLKVLALMNVFWSIVNLFPVLPLDGGQLVRILFEGIFKARGVRHAHFFSLLLSATLSLGSFFIGFLFGGIIFSIFAVQNFAAWKQLRNITESDRDQGLTEELRAIEALLAQEQVSEAIPRLEAVRSRAKKGVIFNVTSLYLANFKAEQKRHREVYELLAPIKKDLPPEAQVQLHAAAYEVSDYPLVTELAANCFRTFPDPLIALHNAEAYAATRQVKQAIGWLQAAQQNGVDNVADVIERPAFDSVRQEVAFQTFLHSIKD